MSDLQRSNSELKLTYSGHKQDLALVDNLVSSLNKRSDRVQTLALKRTKQLDTGHKESKMFYDAWKVTLINQLPPNAF